MNETGILKSDNTQSSILVTDNLAASEPLAVGAVASSGSVGELLRLAREKAGLSLGDVASRLRMGVKQVRALEQDDYAALPKGTFLRGFVRNFSKEVGLKPEQALGLLEQTHLAAVAITASVVVMPSQQNINVPPPEGELATPRARVLISAVIACLLLTVVWWWWEYVRPYRAEGGRPKAATEEKTVSVQIAVPPSPVSVLPAETVSATPQTSPVLSVPSQPETASPRLTTLPAATVAPVVQAAAPPPVKNSAESRPPSPAGNSVLGLTFSDKSWVQVIDGAGKTLLDRTFKGGDAEEVSGRPPFSVVIGNAQATRMAYNGKEVDLAPNTRAAVARVIVK
ncbi:MAG: DUF4115 domain-containing protein [Burkholderiales bacterium]|nr:DUF4115 domain-containing protein [Burkholderiales bacterium]